MELYSQQMKEYLSQIEVALHKYLPEQDMLTESTAKAMQYACEAGGKRIRPVLVLTWADMCGTKLNSVMPFACAIEMIHSYSLIHDDMPCMDNSPLRRGKPSVHKEFGEDIALLAGDGLLTRAFEIMLNPNNSTLSSDRKMEAAYALADAAGINGMVGGQNLDLVSEGKQLDLDKVLMLQSAKTASLIKAACMMGAICSGANKEIIGSAAAFGEYLGIAFQVIDDILDVTSTSEQLGKPTNSDEENHKNTMVSLLGVEKAKELASQYTENALKVLQNLPYNTEDLSNLTRALANRIN